MLINQTGETEMNRVKNIKGEVRGLPYTLIFDQLHNMQACDRSSWRWFLWVNANEYVGHYKTKREAMSYFG